MDDLRDAALDLPAMPDSADVPSATDSSVATPAIPATSLAGAATPTATAGSTAPAGEPHATPGTTSSRSGPRRWLAGVAAVAAVSLLSATFASAATVAVLAPGGYAATSPTVPAITTAGGSTTANATGSIVTVAEIASPAVVTITTTTMTSGRSGAVAATGVGSGFVYDAGGLILTNAHVVEGGMTLTITFGDGRELPGTVVATDTIHDLAVVRVEATGLPVIAIDDTRTLQVGELVVAIGSPLGAYTESVTSGILSATGRTIDVADSSGRGSTTMHGLLQTDAAINPGNSGGPLLDGAGRVIGVNVAVATTAQGIGFAVPITDAAAIMTEARATIAGAA